MSRDLEAEVVHLRSRIKALMAEAATNEKLLKKTQTRELERKTSKRTDLRLKPSVITNSRVRRYLPLCGSRTIGPVP